MLTGGEPDTWNKKILLEDYKIEDSKIDRRKVTVSVPDSSGNYQEITKVVTSKVLIDQAQKDFSREDLPAPTVIKQFEGKKGQTFFKFT